MNPPNAATLAQAMIRARDDARFLDASDLYLAKDATPAVQEAYRLGVEGAARSLAFALGLNDDAYKAFLTACGYGHGLGKFVEPGKA